MACVLACHPGTMQSRRWRWGYPSDSKTDTNRIGTGDLWRKAMGVAAHGRHVTSALRLLANLSKKRFKRGFCEPGFSYHSSRPASCASQKDRKRNEESPDVQQGVDVPPPNPLSGYSGMDSWPSWLKAPDSKSGRPARVSGVRIPRCPPNRKAPIGACMFRRICFSVDVVDEERWPSG